MLGWGSLLPWNGSYRIPFVSSAGAQGRPTHRDAGMTGLNWWEERPLPGSGGVTPAFMGREGPPPPPSWALTDSAAGPHVPSPVKQLLGV